ncbi:relaxase/mobilization nuclease domain-containing protein, partial [Sphingobacterium mizutaii]|uniref:relaxase/mobilization nuclease domain-containing protein n=1 Tax=Sphingobacterium mizutaii TaxID=1010 RepID=UPI00162A5032
MVVEVSTGNGFRSTISYVHKEHEKDLPQDKKPEVIEKNLVFGNTPEMARQMRFVSNANSRISKPVMHVSVSFDAKERIGEEQRQKAVQSVLKEMGVNPQDHQFLIVKHNDTANPH